MSTVALFAQLKLRLLAGNLRGDLQRKLGFVLTLILSVFVSVFGFLLMSLLRLASHGTRGPEVVANAAAQLDEPAGVGVAEILRPKGAHGLVRQLAPNFYGTGVDERPAGVEGPLVSLCR